MPTIYLSPSLQPFNKYVTTGDEQYWMNIIADGMVPILEQNGITVKRNTPGMTLGQAIRESNAGNYDLHLALHSNASGGEQAGQNRGIIAFYYPGSAQGMRAAELLANGLKNIYPLPNLVRAEATTTLGEVRRVRAPAVLLELGFHDNYEDAVWITTHIQAMAENIVLSLTEFFGIPFFLNSVPIPGTVQVDSGVISVYSRPNYSSPVKAYLYNGAQVTVLNEYYGWYLIQFGEEVGYTPAAFIQLE